MLGREMVYDLTELTREFLLLHNNKPLSFYDEMMLHKQVRTVRLENIFLSPKFVESPIVLSYLIFSAHQTEEREALEKEQQRMREENTERKKKEDPLERRIK